MEKVSKVNKSNDSYLDKKLDVVIALLEENKKCQKNIIDILSKKSVVVKSKNIVEVGSGDSTNIENYTRKSKISDLPLSRKVNNSKATISIP